MDFFEEEEGNLKIKVSLAYLEAKNIWVVLKKPKGRP